jgi:2-oxoisovalerate dehydrogenase E1 component alpha subunit
MTIPTTSYLNEKGDLDPTFTLNLPKELIIKAYEVMLMTRYVDEKMITLQRQGTISFALSSLGEEGCSVASAAALDIDDWVYPQYREAGIMFWRGFTIEDYLHQMFGNAKDLILGRQMPNHFGSREINVVTCSSPIGTKIPHAAGCAYAMKMQKDPHVAVCYFGEGASSEGDFHAGLNFAAVRKAPAIFFCRNNGYAISTPACKQFASDGIAPKGIGYGMTTYRVDGNDFFAVYDITKKAKEHCLQGKGPVLIEAITYRMGAHSTSDDPSVYRNEDEVKKWEEKEPIRRLKVYLEKQGWWDDEKEKQALSKIQINVEQAIEIAKKTPKPPLNTLIEQVYFETPEQLKVQFEELKTFFPDS